MKKLVEDTPAYTIKTIPGLEARLADLGKWYVTVIVSLPANSSAKDRARIRAFLLEQAEAFAPEAKAVVPQGVQAEADKRYRQLVRSVLGGAVKEPTPVEDTTCNCHHPLNGDEHHPMHDDDCPARRVVQSETP